MFLFAAPATEATGQHMQRVQMCSISVYMCFVPSGGIYPASFAAQAWPGTFLTYAHTDRRGW